MVNFGIQAMCSSQNMPKIINVIFDASIQSVLDDGNGNPSQTLLSCTFLYYLSVIKLPPQLYLISLPVLYPIPACQGQHPWVAFFPFVIFFVRQ